MATILGIDPGSHVTGYGLVTEIQGNLRCEAFGVLEGGDSPALQQRLFHIGQGIKEIIKTYKPKAIVIEKAFFAKNADSAMKLGQARGVCMYEAAIAGINIYEYNPTEVKSGLTGSGRADKSQVAFVVQALLGLPPMPKFDMSDALALAIHHVRIQSTLDQMKKMEMHS